jgi:hypothetical protein
LWFLPTNLDRTTTSDLKLEVITTKNQKSKYIYLLVVLYCIMFIHYYDILIWEQSIIFSLCSPYFSPNLTLNPLYSP